MGVTKSARSGKLLPAETIAFATSAIFEVVASVRGDFWRKTPDECMLIAEPLEKYVETLPVAKVRAVAGYVLPFTLAVGAFVLLAEPIKMELERKRNDKRTTGDIGPTLRLESVRPQQSGPPTGDQESSTGISVGQPIGPIARDAGPY